MPAYVQEIRKEIDTIDKHIIDLLDVRSKPQANSKRGESRESAGTVCGNVKATQDLGRRNQPERGYY